MRTPIVVAVCALALSAHPREPTSPAGDSAESRSDEDRPLVVRDTAREPEEVIVTAEPPEPGMIPTFEFMQQTYESRGKGACLYINGRYEEAFPFLQAAARKGFKLAQARLGFLYQQGLGTDRDPYAAVGWYGVASTGTTLPEIRNRFRDVWRRIPAEYQPVHDSGQRIQCEVRLAPPSRGLRPWLPVRHVPEEAHMPVPGRGHPHRPRPAGAGHDRRPGSGKRHSRQPIPDLHAAACRELWLLARLRQLSA